MLGSEYGPYDLRAKATIKLMVNMVSNRGLRFSFGYFKSSRLMILRYLSGHPIKVKSVGSTDGWPSWLSDWRSSDVTGIRILLSILSVGRSMVLPAVIDFETLEGPYTGITSSQAISDREIRNALQDLGLRRLATTWRGYHISTKSGPMGQAIGSALTELSSLPDSLIASLCILGGKEFESRIKFLRTAVVRGRPFLLLWSLIFPVYSTVIRRLSFFGDKEGKTRVVGILDYWSQTVLRRIHDSCISFLKTLEPDCTFDQDSFWGKLPTGKVYHSLDLHAATDRIPCELTRRMLIPLIGKRRANAWHDILTGYAFTYRDRSVKYTVGQPMGAYSSWPVGLALIHHLIVRVAALRANIHNFKDYVLLGDDIIIADDAVAVMYMLIMDELGVEITQSKTFHSSKLCEFAKRNFLNGVEITALSSSGLARSWKRYFLFCNYLISQSRRGWQLSTFTEFARVISSVYKFYGKPDRIIQSVLNLSRLYLSVLQDRKSLGAGGGELQYGQVAIECFKLQIPQNGPPNFLIEVWNTALMNRVDRDISTLTEQLAKYVNTLAQKFSWLGADLGDQPYIRPFRLMVNLSEVLNKTPIFSAVERHIDDVDKWMKLHFGRSISDVPTDRVIGIDELSFSEVQFFIPDEIFSMRRDHVVSVVLARFGKDLLTTWKKLSSDHEKASTHASEPGC
jgi:hypothetical protein